MDDDIILDRGRTNVMKFDATNRLCMMRSKFPSLAPNPSRARRRARSVPALLLQHQEAMDAFVNPTSSPVPNATIPTQDGRDRLRREDDMDFGRRSGRSWMEQPQTTVSGLHVHRRGEESDLLNKLARLEKRGFAVNKRLNAYSKRR